MISAGCSEWSNSSSAPLVPDSSDASTRLTVDALQHSGGVADHHGGDSSCSVADDETPHVKGADAWRKRALEGLGSLVAVAILLTVTVASNVADARGVFDWAGEHVGPTCVLFPSGSGTLHSSITVRGWAASDACTAFIQNHPAYSVAQASPSGAAVCEYDRLSVHWIVRDPTGQESGSATCGGISQLPIQ